jgi:hypothetical protein
MSCVHCKNGKLRGKLRTNAGGSRQRVSWHEAPCVIFWRFIGAARQNVSVCVCAPLSASVVPFTLPLQSRRGRCITLTTCCSRHPQGPLQALPLAYRASLLQHGQAQWQGSNLGSQGRQRARQ